MSILLYAEINNPHEFSSVQTTAYALEFQKSYANTNNDTFGRPKSEQESRIRPGCVDSIACANTFFHFGSDAEHGTDAGPPLTPLDWIL